MTEFETLQHDYSTADLRGVSALLEAQAESLVEHWQPSRQSFGKAAVRRYWKEVAKQKDELLAKAERSPDEGPFDTRPPDQRDQLLREHKRLIEGTFKEASEALEAFADLPQTFLDTGEVHPRVFLLTERFLDVAEGRWTPALWTDYVKAIERHEPLLVREIWSSGSTLKVLLLQKIHYYSSVPSETNQQQNTGSALHHMRSCIQSLERLGQVEFSRFLEPLIPFDRILRHDPAGVYSGMDMASRQLYHRRIERIARRSDVSEVEVAEAVVALARSAMERGSRSQREIHVGYYLLSDGGEQLAQKVGYHPKLADRLRTELRRSPDEFYVGGIAAVTGLLIFAILVPDISSHSSMTAVLFALLLMVIPGSQSAVDLMNNVVSRIFKAEALPKLDYSTGVPAEFTTLVAVPTLLLNEKQIQKLVEDVEIR